MYHSFLIHSFAGGHLVYSQYLAIVNCAAMNIGVHRFFWIGVSEFLGYNPSSGMAGSEEEANRKGPLFILSEPLFPFLLILGVFFYLGLLVTGPVLCFMETAFDSFYCVLWVRNNILHFLLALVDIFYFLLHVDIVFSEFIVVSL